MATYASYKKVNGDQFYDETLADNKFNDTTLHTFGVKWFYGLLGFCSPGCCCLWTVPTQVQRLQWELWGAGGNGAGACSCNRCHHFQAAMGGTYSAKTISTVQGCQYSVCAAGVYRCLSRECEAYYNGRTSYVNGYNLSNFCACGGDRARANTSWNAGCFGVNNYCFGPTHNGNDMTIATQRPGWSTAGGNCRCHPQEIHQGQAPKIGGYSSGGVRQCWIRCGYFAVPYGTGGQSALNTFCGSSCCGQGGTGGGGLVKVMYI